MRNIREFLEDKKTFKRVLEILNQHGDVKTNIDETNKLGVGFIAGGSVSNILYYMIHGGNLVINDIDVYNRVDKSNGDKKYEWYSTTNVGGELEIVSDDYGRIFVAENGSKMKVVNHSRKGIFNNMEYIYEVGRQNPSNNNNTKPDKNLTILNGFDLNCCKSGLDLDNSEILFTDDFVEFLKTKELKVVSPCAPIQTSIRLRKKISDLNCFCDIDAQMRYLTVASKHIQSGQMVKYIGVETYNKYLKHKDFVDKYFKIREPQNSKEIPQPLIDTFYIGNKRNPNVNIWLFEPILGFDIIDYTYNISNFKKLWELLYTYKKKADQDKINKIYYKNVVIGNMTEDQWVYEKWLGMVDNVNTYETQPSYNPTNRFTVQMLLTKKDYYKCDFDIKHVDYIDKFNSEHHNIRFFLKNCNTIMEQYKLIKSIKSMANKEGDWIIGLLENLPYDTVKNVTTDNIRIIIEDEKKKHTKDLVEKLDLSGFEYAGCVNELTSSLDLRVEGVKMGHCVGGYSHSLENGRSRIFHINCDGIGSTLEVRTPKTTKHRDPYSDIFSLDSEKSVIKIVDVYKPKSSKNDCFVTYDDGTTDTLKLIDVSYNMNQHQGRYPEKGNLVPTDLNKKIAKELITYLNIHCLPENYKIDLAEKEDSRIFV